MVRKYNLRALADHPLYIQQQKDVEELFNLGPVDYGETRAKSFLRAELTRKTQDQGRQLISMPEAVEE